MALFETERKIEELIDALNDKGKGIPKNVSGFSGLPYDNYQSLLDDLGSGFAHLFRFAISMEPSLLNLVAQPKEKFGNTVGLIVAYGGVITSIAVAYFLSWWLLTLIPVVFFMEKVTTC